MSADQPDHDRAVLIRIAAIAAAALSAVAAVSTQTGLFRRFWFNDLSYFWAAGSLWRDGVSPYVPGFIERANALIPTRHVYSDFYYAPAIRPLAELLAGLPLADAANLFFVVNIAALAASCFLLGDVAARQARRGGRLAWSALFLVVACVVLRHPLVVAAIGQITLLLLFGFSLFLYALAAERPRLAVLSIILLLMKPHFGIAVCVFCALHAPLRRPLAAALVVYGALTLYGLSTAPSPSLQGFLHNIAAYAAHPRHDPAHASGLGQILSAFGLAAPTPALVILLVGGAALVSGAQTTRERVLAAALLPLWTLVVGPNHMEDFAVLVPLLLFAIGSDARRTAIIAIAFVLVGRGHELTTLAGIVRENFLGVRTAIHTVGLGLLLIAAVPALRVDRLGVRLRCGFRPPVLTSSQAP